MKDALQGKDRLTVLADVLKACSDQTRLRLLYLLATTSEICVCDLVTVIGTNQPKISRHLAYLKRVGLVQDRKEGLWAYYSLVKPLQTELAALIDCVIANCERQAAIQHDVQAFRQLPDRFKEAKNIKVETLKPEPRVVVIENELQIELL